MKSKSKLNPGDRHRSPWSCLFQCWFVWGFVSLGICLFGYLFVCAFACFGVHLFGHLLLRDLFAWAFSCLALICFGGLFDLTFVCLGVLGIRYLGVHLIGRCSQLFV